MKNDGSAAELGGERVSEAHLLQQTREGRALCGLGTAGTVQRRDPRVVPIPSLIGV